MQLEFLERESEITSDEDDELDSDFDEFEEVDGDESWDELDDGFDAEDF